MAGHQVSEEEYKKQVSNVWKVTVILSIVTIVEVAIALIFGGKWSKFLLNSLFVLFSLAKAGYIIGEFMHLKYEKRVFMLSLGLPLAFLVWAIIAFAVEGSYLNKLLYFVK